MFPYTSFFRTFFLLSMLLFALFKVHAAEVDIKGIDDDRVLKNVRAHVESLDLPSASYQFSQYQDSLQLKVEAATQVFGYYHATSVATPPSVASDNLFSKNKNWSLLVDLGAVTLVRTLSIKIVGQGAQDQEIQSLLSSINLKQGKPLEHSVYEKAKNDLQSLALSRGYFDFEFEQSSIKVFESLNAADITLHINSGVRYKFADLRFGKDTRSQQLVKSLTPFKTGDLYQASQLGLLNQRLKQTQYFRHVIVRPLVAEAVDDGVPIEVILTHKPRDNFDVGLGYSSDVRARFTGKWKRPWVNESGHSIGAEVFVSSPEQYVSVNYKVPLEDAIQNYLSYQAGFQAQNENDTSSHKWSISATRHWTVENSDWQRSAFIRLEQETFIQGLEPEQTTHLLTPGFTLSRLRSKGGMDINWGDKQTITTEFASDSLLSDINMLRITASSKWVRSVEQHRFVWRAEVGGIVSNDFDQIPSSLRYFTGGDQSVRGFDYKTLSPFELDSDGDPELTGGQYLAVASIEYSYPVAENWRAAAFVDAGNATEELFKDPAIGVGFGAIWNSPIGPVRLYLAKGKSDFGSSRYFHISMGPSL
ncbi:autotransporter assembly complex protein TamA [Paraglaciecola arctica]|uniref:Translocation and assembly module subunit TamA n=1 Tax=Paraglaciecola arctica BSs20135 TaxID=493475 RepID=K6XB80_9ALTE|nr:autotransporter assembly complex family protein [Paraglaciecola arctica]GAC17874.1 outer membrane protein [Paraglaciecola arctica BSs20135]